MNSQDTRPRRCNDAPRPVLLSLFCCALLAAGAARPETPVSETPAPGHRVFGGTNDSLTLMADAEGVVVSFWPSAFDSGYANYLDRDGALLRVVDTEVLNLGGAAGGLQRVALDGTVLWDFRYDSDGKLSHHDVDALPNGNVLIVAWEEKTAAEQLAAGRLPDLIGGVLRPDHIVEVRQTGLTTGEIVWEWHVWDHLVQDFDPAVDNFGVVADHPELVDINYPARYPNFGDWNHVNGIDYDPVYDRIWITATKQDEIWVIDHSTTTEEAAGHSGGRWGSGGDLLYRWGNPRAYDSGSQADQVFNTHHSPRVIPPGYPGEGNYLVFLNRSPSNEDRSAVWELVPPLDADGALVLDPSGVYGPDEPLWTYTADGFYSSVMSSAERLPNGNTLICSATQKRMFEVDSEGNIVWQYQGTSSNYFNAQYIERWLWADRGDLSAREGGSIVLDLIAGTPHAGKEYLLLAGRSGTEPGLEIDGVVLPLNPDALTRLARNHPNSQTFDNNSGALDSNGRAQAIFNLPTGSPLVAGAVVHFAYLLTDSKSGDVVFTSNEVAVQVIE